MALNLTIMSPAITKSRPISHELLKKLRARQHHFCPFCGHEYVPWRAQKYRLEHVYFVDCSKCTRNFWVPYRRSFDPSSPLQISLGADGWGKCPCCLIRFKFRRKYEQCPGCGKVLIGGGSRLKVELRDNEAEALETIRQFHATNRKPRWRFWS